ncbi:MAG: universal stress protein [Nocardioides sp.]
MTTDTREQGCVVVAVDGSEEGYASVAFATREASRSGLALHVVHVMPAYLPVGPLVMMAADENLGAYASETLASAARMVADIDENVPVTTEVLAGGRVSEIVRAAEKASFVVLGRRPASALDRAWSGGTLDGVVSRAHCPVVVVPGTARAEAAVQRVVVGYKSSEHADELFDAGFRAAARLGARLEVVHAWKLAGGYDDIIAGRVSEPGWNREQKDAIWAAVSPWQDAYPHVGVRVQVVHEHPVRALLDASHGAARLILVKPLHGARLHHLGRTARGALRFAECPIEVVAALRPQQLDVPPVEVERAGDLVR